MGLGDSIKKLSKSLGIGRNGDSVESSSESEELDLARLQDSESDSELNNSDESSDSESEDVNKEDSEEEEEEEDDVPLSDAEIDDDADVIPFQKLTVNNVNALRKSLKSIELPQSAKSNFVEHFSVTSEPIVLKDVYDDTERELSFYKQALDAAIKGRKQAKSAGVAFSRPVDYFAEMVKSDEHMAKVKGKLVDLEKTKRVAQEARKQRELKKYGKKVQHEKLQQRQKEKRDTLEKINGLKRKRKDTEMDDSAFDVQVEDALNDKKTQRDEKYRLGNQRNNNQKGKPVNRKRLAKNSRYGSGHKRGERKNTSESSMDVSKFKASKKHRK